MILSVLAGGLGSTAWTLATAAQPHSGSIPTSGPTASAMGGGFGAAGRTARDGGNVSTSGAGAGMGGMGEGTTSTELTALLKSSGTKWSAIVSGATQAASLELATGTSVIALGGWNGGDPYPTLAQFQAMVDRGEIGYFISGGWAAWAGPRRQLRGRRLGRGELPGPDRGQHHRLQAGGLTAMTETLAPGASAAWGRAGRRTGAEDRGSDPGLRR